ncbi:type II toxin-antitoxin system mRNA interferase toxin, RelE/StbE family [Candidatus Azambacteria bacterium]|nr:type II toxin-antitoxin system mRNA interferase toxin, RelE/StbE family [Candidatus Azambacteria bacterium]
MYTIFYITAVKKDLKDLSTEARQFLDQHFAALSENPFQGEFLHGEFRGYFSYHFPHKGTDYRIIYRIVKEELVVLVIMIGSRKNLYSRLKKRVR